MSDRIRNGIIGAAGVMILLLALAGALLPLAENVRARPAIGTLLLAAGGIELVAAMVRRDHRPSTALAAIATVVAGLRLLLDPNAGFFEVLNLVILWLIVRAAALGFAAYCAADPMRSWLAFSGAIDFLLGIALLAGLPIALIVVGLFGPTRPISATFAWVVALSFVGTAALLFATATLEGRRKL